MPSRFRKDPDAIKDYHFDWSDWLEDGDSIDSYTITPSSGITVDSDSESGGIVTVWLSGGTADTSATVTCRIVTTEGRRDDKTMFFEFKPE